MTHTPMSRTDHAIAEQRRCREWLREHGHDHAEARGVRLGASDWLMEEVLMLRDIATRDVEVVCSWEPPEGPIRTKLFTISKICGSGVTINLVLTDDEAFKVAVELLKHCQQG